MNYYRKILDIFFDEFLRPPTQSEFEDITGELGKIKYHYGNYGSFLNEYGYRKTKRNKTYSVFDGTGELLFKGTIDEVAAEYEVSESSITYCELHEKMMSGKYYVRRKNFILNDFLLTLREKGVNLQTE